MARAGLQWMKQPDGTLVLWDTSKGSAPISAAPTGPQSIPGTDTSDVARQMFEDKQGTRSPTTLDLLTKNLPEVPPATGDGHADFNAFINALFATPTAPGEEPDLEGGQSLGTAEGATPVEPTKGEQPVSKEQLTKIRASASGKSLVDGMIKRGWTPEEAAALAGNVHVESGFRPEIKSKAAGEQSYGFMQWNKERLAGLKNMAAAKGIDWRDPEAQMDWIHMERTGESAKYGGSNEASAYKKAFGSGGTPAQLAERFGRYVERPKDLSQSVKQRMSAADQYAALVQKSKAAATPTEIASVGITKLDPLAKPQPFSNQSMNEEMFSSILSQGGPSWG